MKSKRKTTRVYCLVTYMALIIIHLICFKAFPGDFTGPGFNQNTFAVIGDYGSDSPNESNVASLVKSWNPEYIITTGDNNYPAGAYATIDANVGKYYHDYIKPYTGNYGAGADTNRFFPALGNHDLISASGAVYYNYFTLPGNERYYDFIKGNVHFFVINSDTSEINGTTVGSIQAEWLKNKLSSSVSKWKIVYFHHSPYASDKVHGNSKWMHWPFKDWGADIVLSGHSHIYERVILNNFPYIVNGLGGESLYALSSPVTGSQIRYNSAFGALRVDIKPDTLWFRFYTTSHIIIDSYYLVKHDSTTSGIPLLSDKNQLNLFPNPNQGNFTITAMHAGNTTRQSVKLVVEDISGHEILSREVNPFGDSIKESFDLGLSVNAGIYIIIILFEEKKEKIRFLVLK